MSGYAVLIAAADAARVLAALPELGWRLADAAGRISGIDGDGEVCRLASAEQARPFLEAGGLLIWHGPADAATLGVAYHWREPGVLKLQLDGMRGAQRDALLAGLDRLLIGRAPVRD